MEYIWWKHTHMFNSCILHPDDTGIPQGSVLGPIPFSIYTRSLDSLIQMHGFSISLPCRQISGLLFMPLSVFTSVISYPSDISTWMNNQHLELNLSRLSCSQDGFWLSNTAVTSRWIKALDICKDDQLAFSEHITAVTQPYGIMMHNSRKKFFLADLNFLLNFFLQIEEAEIIPPTLNHK